MHSNAFIALSTLSSWVRVAAYSSHAVCMDWSKSLVPAFIAFLAHEQAVGTLDVVFEEDPLLQLIKKKKTSIEKKYFMI